MFFVCISVEFIPPLN